MGAQQTNVQLSPPAVCVFRLGEKGSQGPYPDLDFLGGDFPGSRPRQLRRSPVESFTKLGNNGWKRALQILTCD